MGVVASQAPVGVHNPLKSLIMGPSFWANAISKTSFKRKLG